VRLSGSSIGASVFRHLRRLGFKAQAEFNGRIEGFDRVVGHIQRFRLVAKAQRD
jgi:hypothetical protein